MEMKSNCILHFFVKIYVVKVKHVDDAMMSQNEKMYKRLLGSGEGQQIFEGVDGGGG
jgi:hypothetical protein